VRGRARQGVGPAPRGQFLPGWTSNEVEVIRADSSAGSGCFAVRKTCSRNRLASGRPNSRGCRLPWSRMKVRSQDTSCVVVGSDAPHCRAACATWSSKRSGSGAMIWGLIETADLCPWLPPATGNKVEKALSLLVYTFRRSQSRIKWLPLLTAVWGVCIIADNLGNGP